MTETVRRQIDDQGQMMKSIKFLKHQIFFKAFSTSLLTSFITILPFDDVAFSVSFSIVL